jgi:hypothetical protein
MINVVLIGACGDGVADCLVGSGRYGDERDRFCLFPRMDSLEREVNGSTYV